MYKLFNYLFGWDYIAWKNSADSGIARVRLDGEGNPYYFRYESIGFVDKLPADRGQTITWLTCSPSKYIK